DPWDDPGIEPGAVRGLQVLVERQDRLAARGGERFQQRQRATIFDQAGDEPLVHLLDPLAKPRFPVDDQRHHTAFHLGQVGTGGKLQQGELLLRGALDRPGWELADAAECAGPSGHQVLNQQGQGAVVYGLSGTLERQQQELASLQPGQQGRTAADAAGPGDGEAKLLLPDDDAGARRERESQDVGDSDQGATSGALHKAKRLSARDLPSRLCKRYKNASSYARRPAFARRRVRAVECAWLTCPAAL